MAIRGIALVVSDKLRRSESCGHRMDAGRLSDYSTSPPDGAIAPPAVLGRLAVLGQIWRGGHASEPAWLRGAGVGRFWLPLTGLPLAAAGDRCCCSALLWWGSAWPRGAGVGLAAYLRRGWVGGSRTGRCIEAGPHVADKRGGSAEPASG